MTYEEYFRHTQEELFKTQPGPRQLTEQEVDEEIALVSQLPCTGGGAASPLFSGQSIALDARALDRGEKFPGQPCPHCTLLAVHKWTKSAHEAKRNGLPEPPWPWSESKSAVTRSAVIGGGPIDDSRKRFADEVMEVIHGELKQLTWEGKKDCTECEQRMIMCLNRIGHEVRKLGFKS